MTTMQDYIETRIAFLKQFRNHWQTIETNHKEHLIKAQATGEVFEKIGSSEYRAIASAQNLLLGEVQILLEHVMALNEISLTYFEEILMMLKTTTETISTQSAKTPELEKLNSQMMKKLEEHDQFINHVIKKLSNDTAPKETNNPLPKETKPHEGMYE